ncbi:MAG TPA: response regulator [Pseudomonadota bacterium]|nr:response regulator [Pseudomonadota bacterium]
MERAPQHDQRAKIFVLDDSQTFLTYVQLLLQAERYVVHSFDSPLGITREVIRHQPDMVIVDVNMPSITGDKVCQLVRAASYGKGVVILLHSSLPEAELSELARRCGADGSIPKSRDPKLLTQAVERFLARRSRLFSSGTIRHDRAP